MEKEMKTKANKPMRNSGIELFKVIGMFLIVICHVLQTLSENPNVEKIISQEYATNNIQTLLMIILRYCGVIGNTIFFVSSAWFLLDSKKFSMKKEFFMLFEVWIVSVLIMFILIAAGPVQIGKKMMIKSLFPTFFATNWYMTCYLLFYPIHTVLNSVIQNMSQKNLLRTATVMAFLYLGMNTVRNSFFASFLIQWITIYFVVAYLKFYMKDFCDSKKGNLIMFILCLGMTIGMVVMTNILGLRIAFFSNKVQYWRQICNPFIVFGVIAMLNLVRRSTFRSKFINGLSSLSLLIYIIHENYLLRTYYRPKIINLFYREYGYDYVVPMMLLIALIIFVASAIISFVYVLILRKLVEKIGTLLLKIWEKAEAVIMKCH